MVAVDMMNAYRYVIVRSAADDTLAVVPLPNRNAIRTILISKIAAACSIALFPWLWGATLLTLALVVRNAAFQVFDAMLCAIQTGGRLSGLVALHAQAKALTTIAVCSSLLTKFLQAISARYLTRKNIVCTMVAFALVSTQDFTDRILVCFEAARDFVDDTKFRIQCDHFFGRIALFWHMKASFRGLVYQKQAF